MDAQELLEHCGVAVTKNRLLVVRALSGAEHPQTPLELLSCLTDKTGLAGRMNRVTLYRILDLLVERGVAARHNAGERSFRYCLGRGVHGHSHFHCNRCGQTQCLDSRLLEPGLSRILSGLPMRVDLAEITLGGVCEGCQNT
ncbi:MAG: transcriptional repressor [Deltaproteobacteria bacterium HGW-Deltaproteobacteria-8]|jgi:Fur family ferric uptake transcriptional regulator|nr:MAG: transcriptional repressor [Deltaproteobacteria bacterium HGW-Deltaproteobacteria-8]